MDKKISRNEALTIKRALLIALDEHSPRTSKLKLPKSKISKFQFQAITKIAKQCNDDEWIDYVLNGEQPPVKLATNEMESLKGGIEWGEFWDFVKAGIGIV